MMAAGGINRVSSVSGPSSGAWLKRRRDGLAAQHRALDEGRIDDLVQLMQDDQEAEEETQDPSDEHGSDEPPPDPEDERAVSAELAREVAALATDLEARIARVRAETLDELQDLDRRVDAGRIGAGHPGGGNGRRGGNFSGYL